MGICCSRGNPAAPTQETAPSTHSTTTALSHVAPSSKGTSGISAHDTPQRDYEMTPLSPQHSAVTPERMRSQDSTSSQCHHDDRARPPPSSDSNSQRPFLYQSRGGVSPSLQKPITTDTTLPQGSRSHSSSQMIRTSSTLPSPGPQTQFESRLASGTGQIQDDRKERQPHFPCSLQSLLSNDFRCVIRCRAFSHNNCCIVIHRFRILVVGKVCIMYLTGRRRN
jgi:hypothetical protein